MVSTPEVIWNEMAPREHFVQFYEDDSVLLDTVDGFIGSGLEVGDAGIVIATTEHLRGLEERFKRRAIDVQGAIEKNQYVPLDASDLLSKFMNKGWPDQARFLEVTREIISCAAQGNRRVRAFGEMVALLWADGNRPATIRLEKLWNDLGKSESFSLFCAYPKESFSAAGLHGSLIDVCCAHSRILSASGQFEKHKPV